MTISVIIPNYNGKNYLNSCLGSIENSTLSPTEIIIVDNGSTDGSQEFIKKKFPRVKIISLPKNYGFAKAVNMGIKKSKGDYIALLNNDTKVDKNWLLELEKTARSNPDFFIFASNILSWDGEKIDSQGITFFWKGKAEQINQDKNFSPATIHKPPLTVFGASAAAALYKKDLFKRIGFFDEDFASYLEDVDFALRAQISGEKCLFVPGAIVHHLGGATRKKMGNFKERMDAKNWIFVIIKNYPINFLIKFLLQIFVERLRNLNGILKVTPILFWLPTLFSVYSQVLIKLPKMFQKRFEIQKLGHGNILHLIKNSPQCS